MLAFALFATVRVAPVRAQLAARVVLRMNGIAAGDHFGQGLAPAGDVNGDGYDDFLVGAAYADGVFGDVGRAYVFLGGAHLDSIADVTVIGRTPSGHAGLTLAGVGDVNCDGYDDWLVGSPNYDTGTPPRFTGKVWLDFGGANPDGISDRTIDTPRPGIVALYGTALAGVGDFNADGYPDFAVGGFVASPDSSSTYVYWGGPGLDVFPDLLLHMPPGFTSRAIAAGDVNGDGWPDIVVGASASQPGRLFVYFGGPGADGEPDVVLASTGSFNDLFGYAVSCGDFNGDGYADILVSAAGRNVLNGIAAGEVLLYRGGPTLGTAPPLILDGEAAGDLLGSAVAFVGDLDGDGFDDVAIGAPNADGPAGVDAGKVYVCFGGAIPDLVPDLVLNGEAALDLFGSAVSPAGDPDLRGSPALLVGATGSDAGFANGGRASLYRIACFGIVDPRAGDRWKAGLPVTVHWTGSDLADIELSLDDGATWRELAGGVGGAGDNVTSVVAPATVSGRARLRITRTGHAPTAGASTLSAGLFHVAPPAAAFPAVLAEPDAARTGAGRLGSAVAAGFDWNGDGVPDLVAGAPAEGDGAITIFDGALPDSVLAVIAGFTPLEKFGASVADAGDLDGDGHDDLAVGAPGAAIAGEAAGRVYVFAGAAGARTPAHVLEGHAGELFGTAVAAAGDVNADHRADLVVGAPGVGGIGRAYVFDGGPAFGGAPDRTLNAGIPGPFGLVVAGIGDVNGDGAGDLLVSAPPLPGGNGSDAVHLFFGSPSPGRLDRLILEGESVGDGFGSSFAPLGDVDHDGFADFAIGAPLADRSGGDAGAVFIYFGTSRFVPVPGLVIDGRAPDEFLGSALAGGTDLDGDGVPDLVIGAPGAYAGAGRVDVLFGGSDSLADLAIAGAPASRLGTSVAVGPARAGAPGVVAAGAPFMPNAAGEGGLRRFEIAPWRILEPASGSTWLPGTTQPVRWSGTLRADVSFVAAGRPPVSLARDAGGAASNAIDVLVPASLPDSGRVVLSSPGVTGDLESAIVRTAPSESPVPPPPAGLRVWPQPGGRDGLVHVAFAAPLAHGEVATDLDVAVFDVRGRRVVVLLAGRPTVTNGAVHLGWDGRDFGGRALGPGLYFVRARSASAGMSLTRRLVMLDRR